MVHVDIKMSLCDFTMSRIGNEERRKCPHRSMRCSGRWLRADGSEVLAALKAAARERILILDGAMGTQIQGLGFDEEHFRGDKFVGCACHQQGNNDLLILTQPDGDRGNPLSICHRRRRHPRNQHVLLDLHRAGRLWHGGRGLRTQPRRRAAGAARGDPRRAGRRQAPLRRRRARADQPHRVDVAGRQQSRLSRRQLRRSAHPPMASSCAG